MNTREALELLDRVREVHGDGRMLPREIAEKYEELVLAYQQAAAFVVMLGVPDARRIAAVERLFGEFNYLYTRWMAAESALAN